MVLNSKVKSKKHIQHTVHKSYIHNCHLQKRKYKKLMIVWAYMRHANTNKEDSGGSYFSHWFISSWHIWTLQLMLIDIKMCISNRICMYHNTSVPKSSSQVLLIYGGRQEGKKWLQGCGYLVEQVSVTPI